MSCHIYKVSDHETKTVRFSTRPQQHQDREERVVEIHQSADNGLLEPHQVACGSQTWSGPTSVWLKIITSGLILLCVIQLFAVVFRTYYYVQEKEKAATETPGLCPQLWTRFHCSCLFVSLEKKTWNQSRAECEQRGADLIVINSKEKQNFMIDLRTDPKPDLWIGLVKDQGFWTWVNSDILDGFRYWKINVSPHHAAEGSAAFMTENGPWNYSTGGHKGFVCELEI